MSKQALLTIALLTAILLSTSHPAVADIPKLTCTMIGDTTTDDISKSGDRVFIRQVLSLWDTANRKNYVFFDLPAGSVKIEADGVHVVESGKQELIVPNPIAMSSALQRCIAEPNANLTPSLVGRTPTYIVR